MAIYEAQYQKLLTRELMRYLIQGRLPNIEELSKRLSVLLGRGGNTIYQYAPQNYKSVFNNSLFNRQLKQIKFDIDLFHDELISLFGETIKRFNFADLYHKVNSYELARLESALNNILFTIEDADFFFLGSFDNFTDYSKTNIPASTPAVIDLSEKCLALPYGGRNTKKIKTSHLYNEQSWPVKILSPDPSRVISSKTIPTTSFGNIFSDLTQAWIYEIITSEQTEVKIQFTFPLAGDIKEEAEVFVNRIELIPHSPNKQAAIVRFSTDNINFNTPTGYEDGLILKDQGTTYGMDFETNLVQFIQVELTKSGPDEEIQVGSTKQFRYLFGLKNISAYTIGRLSEARYESKPFDFSSSKEKISKVSLRATTSVPAGTHAKFSVALTNENDELVSSFQPIKPLGQKGSAIGAAEVINFATTKGYYNRFALDPNSPLYSIYENFKGNNLYKINSNITPAPIFGTSRLTRGFQVWYRDSSVAIKTTEVSDVYVKFPQSDIEAIYAVTTETPSPIVDTSGPTPTITLITAKRVYYDRDRGHSQIPNDITTSKSNPTPNYAIYEVLHIPSIKTRTIQVTADSQTVTLGNPRVNNFKLSGTEAPRVTLASNGNIYTEGRDYQFEVETRLGASKPTGRLVIPSGSNIQISATTVLNFSYTIDQDVTYKVSDIRGNQIVLDKATMTSGDTFLVTYRFIPVSPDDIIKASVRVKDGISTARNLKYYVEGQDYIIDTSTGSILRLPNGTIASNGAVYIDFQYKNSDTGIETFLTWCRITDEAGARIRLEVSPTTNKNTLTADDKMGEKLLVNTSQGLIDITKALTTPVLGPGWVQFIVRSKNPDTNRFYGTNLIDQVIQLRDVNRERIFKEGGRYFKDILAIREPMVERTLNHLKVNTLISDHTVFSIVPDTTTTDQHILIVNFQPNTTSELYTKVPQDDNSTIQTPQDYYEVYRLEWDSKISNTPGTKIIVRCDLSRDPQGVDGSISPKVFDYNLRAGF